MVATDGRFGPRLDVRPMLATPGQLPPHDDEWAYETKWDGVRALVTVSNGRVGIRSRNDIDVTIAYPELASLGSAVGPTDLLLDGEIVAFDADGKPSFGALQPRMHVSDAGVARRLSHTTPATLVLFDLLWLDGHTVMSQPYTRRRELLDGLALTGPSWQTPAATVGHGADLLAATKELGLEGVVAKRRRSQYLPGRRSPDWIKIKNIRSQEVVVGGWTPGKGRRDGTVGALLLGVPAGPNRPTVLHYVGKVGTGFSDALLRELSARLRHEARPSSPFDGVLPAPDRKDAHWVEPTLVGEVAFSEWTSDGRLRHPAWRGERADKAVSDVVIEP